MITYLSCSRKKKVKKVVLWRGSIQCDQCTDLPYSNRRFLDRARAYNDLFALEISGGQVASHSSKSKGGCITRCTAPGQRQRGIEVHAVLSCDEAVTDPRRLTDWKVGTGRPSSIDLFSPLMEPFQYPLLYPQGTLGWLIGVLDDNGKNFLNITIHVVSCSPILLFLILAVF
ncbi:hypothetical protein J6590_091296 [Homalodisca vitripennis]|nr:hypothetical protein J6590_091296 [Homalodisca vitripennis]